MTTNEFKLSIDEYGPRLLQFAVRQVSDMDLAKDLVQETFIALMGKLNDVEVVKAKPFLFAVISNKIKDFYKLKKDTTEVQPFHQTGSTQAAYESKEIVHLALARLDQRDKELIVLRDLEGFSYDEIAEATSLTLAQVKVYLFRARKSFKEQVIKLEVQYER